MTRLISLRNALIVLALALMAALGYETDWGSALFNGSPATVRTPTGKHEMATVLPDFKLSSEASTYSQIVDKPLLNPTRKPAPTQIIQAATEPPKPQIRRGLYQLVGVTDFGKTRVAQLREVASNRVQSVREGDKLQELTVKKIDSAQVVLVFQNETDVVDLPKFTASGKVPAPPAPVAPPAPPPVAAATPPTPAAAVASRPVGNAVPLPGQAPTPGVVAAPATAAAPTTDRNALISNAPLPNGQPYTPANADAFIEARRRARFGQ
ncbi:MAG: hypothetical protein JNL19_00555 [Burkholderiales bacterium]|nr:hypothetical protein [Burkholderiales bacterium]